MTPEERMRDAIVASNRDIPVNGRRNEVADRLAKHGAAAIRAALDEQRAMIVAWLAAEVREQNRLANEAENDDRPDAAGEHFTIGESIGPYAAMILRGEPEAWAKRTGWRP